MKKLYLSILLATALTTPQTLFCAPPRRARRHGRRRMHWDARSDRPNSTAPETGQNGRHVLRHLARHERLRHLHEAIARRRRPHSAADRYAESVRQPETDDRKSAESAIRTAVGIPSLGRTLPGLLPGRRRLGNPQTRANADRCGRGRHHRRPDQCGDLPAAVEKPLQSIYADPGSRRKNPATVIHLQHAGPGDRPTSVRQFYAKGLYKDLWFYWKGNR